MAKIYMVRGMSPVIEKKKAAELIPLVPAAVLVLLLITYDTTKILLQLLSP